MNEWIKWDGGECPVPPNKKIRIRLRGGLELETSHPENLTWAHTLTLDDILEYRVLSCDPEENKKLSNPKDVIGVKKVAFSCLPTQVLARAALGMMEGACKYGRFNYRVVGVRASVYYDALVARHITPWWEGQDIDPDSGMHHLDKALSCLMVLRDAMLQGKCEDDRPPPGKGYDLVELNTLAAEIIDRHKDKTPKHYTIKDEV